MSQGFVITAYAANFCPLALFKYASTSFQICLYHVMMNCCWGHPNVWLRVLRETVSWWLIWLQGQLWLMILFSLSQEQLTCQKLFFKWWNAGVSFLQPPVFSAIGACHKCQRISSSTINASDATGATKLHRLGSRLLAPQPGPISEDFPGVNPKAGSRLSPS